MPGPLLKTKLYFPPAREQLVARPRLVERLELGLRGPLTLISAPPGSGKTTLMSAWRAGPGRGRPAAWVALDAGENDPLRFLNCVAGALEDLFPGRGTAALSLLQTPQVPTAETVLEVLLNDLSPAPADFVLALDDYHEITAPSVHQALRFLIEHLPPDMHLVIISRADPSLPLARLRARGQLVEIRAGDLRFTPAEAADFLCQVMRLPLAQEAIAALVDRTEGWAAGLQLAGLALQGLSGQVDAARQEDAARQMAQFIEDFAGSHHYIVDYLVEEVLNRQPEPVRTFLLQTSILDWMSGPLCNAVVRGAAGGQNLEAQSVLEQLEHANLFVLSLDPAQRWYRYHHLFADLLRQRLAMAYSREMIETLHQRAGTWYEQQGYPVEAVQHLLAASRTGQAANLIAREAMREIYQGEVSLVGRWLDALPEGEVSARPVLCLARAWVAYLTESEPSRPFARRWLEQAEGALARLGDYLPAEEATSFLANSVALRAYLTFDGGQDPHLAIEYARQALENLPGDSGSVRSSLIFLMGQGYLAVGDRDAALRSLAAAAQSAAACDAPFIAFGATYIQAAVYREMGRLHRAAELCRQALQELPRRPAAVGRPIPGSEALRIVLGSILLEWNELEEASEILRQGLEQSAAQDTIVYRFESFTANIRLHQALGEPDRALERMDQACRSLPVGFYFQALGAQIHLSQVEKDPRHLHAAADWAAQSSVSLESGRSIGSIVPLLNRDVERVTFARLQIARRISLPPPQQPDLQPVLRYLQDAADQARAEGWVTREIELLLLAALAWRALGDVRRALDPLGRALALAEPEGFAMSFLLEGEPAFDLLREAARHGVSPVVATRLLEMFGRPQSEGQTGPKIPQPGLVEPLSPREIEVLGLIAAGCSNKEIAARLVISLQTVKRHTVNIFGKLAVKNRTEAVARARETGIL
jgi:LuxR family transcriptional regulator, maltose regulon positive regulatory protein